MDLQRINRLLMLATGLSFASLANGAGFSIIEQSVSGIGNAFAGGSASAEDASTIFFNPAGMILLDEAEFQAGVHAIVPSFTFHNEGSLTAGTISTQGSDSDGGATAYVPNFYYVQPVSKNLALGLGIYAPFGLGTEYDDDFVGRYTALKSEISTINVNPSVAYRINSHLTLGAGFNVESVSAQLTNAIDFNRDGTTLLDGKSDLEADDIGCGYNVGLLYEFTSATRVGLHYRSQVKVRLKGDADFTLPDALAATSYASIFYDQKVEADLTLPDTLSLSVYHDINSQWSVMGDVTWTNWSEFYSLDVDFEDSTTEAYSGSPVIENWEDSFRYSVGASYKLSDSLKLRTGLCYDQTPISSAYYRSPRIPDASRFWISLGASWDVTKSSTLDIGYVHIFVEDPEIDNSTHTAYQHVIGTIDASIDLFCTSFTYRF